MNWSERKLGEFISIKHGWAFKGEFFIEEGKYLLLTPGNAYETGGLKLRPGKEKFYAGEFPPEFLLRMGDMLVVMTDLIQAAPILGGAIVVPEDGRYLHNQRLGLVEYLYEKPIDKAFLYYVLNSPAYRAQVRGSATGATVRHTAPKRICSCSVMVPNTFREQQQVATILSAYDGLIATNQRRIALLEEAARRLYREWFVHLRFPGHESVPVKDGVPEGWQTGMVYDYIAILSGGTPKTGMEHYWGGEIPFFTPKDSPDAFYVLETEKTLTEAGLANCNSRYFSKNTTFITARGTVGKVALAQKPMAMNQSCYALVPKQDYDELFLFLAIKDAVNHFKKVASGGVFDAIVVDTFKIIPFVLPKAEITHAFGNIVRPIFQQLESLLLQNSALAHTRDLLLPKLMSGQLDVSGIRLPEEVAV
jgi:type I restriction enzyme S subunit